MSKRPSRDGLLKDGTSRLAKAGSRRGMPRIMWLAIAVCVVGAFMLFRGQSSPVPAGIGERRSVVTVGADTTRTPADAPRSGDVDLAAETRSLTAEKPSGGAATEAKPAEAKPIETAPVQTKPATKAATQSTATSTAKPAAPAPGTIVPAPDGPWLVQAGSFGQADNADKVAATLRAQGWDARVKVGNTSDGAMIHRVQIGWFASRQQAEDFIAQNRKALAGAIAVHR